MNGTSHVARREDVRMRCGPERRASCWSREEFIAIREEDGVFLGPGYEDDAHGDGW
jgi:hypothetical protein